MDKGRQQVEEVAGLLAPLLLLFDRTGKDLLAQAAWLLAKGRENIESLRLRLQAIEGLESQLQTLQAQIELDTVQDSNLQRQRQAARHADETVSRDRLRLEQQIRDERTWIEGCRRDLVCQLQPLGINGCPPDQARQLLIDLENRQQHWKAHQERNEQLLRHLSGLQTELDKLDLLLATIDSRLSQQDGELETLRREEAGLLAERFEIYGDRDPNVEEQRLNMLVQQAEARELAIRTRLNGLDRELHGLGEQLRVANEEQAGLLTKHGEQEARLHGQLPSAGFADLNDFRSALMPPDQLTDLIELNRELEREQTRLSARRTEQDAALEREEAQRDDEQGEEALRDLQMAGNRELEALQQRIGADRERLAVNSRHKEQGERQQQALAAQRRELERWELLHQLIGSADGKKVRVFAQGLTFEVMISHANRQLRKMNDRYILLRDSKEPLALQVIDNYQAGEIRSARNLSGGESFLVSLALSLGLAAMASHNVRVDSLFLDEGFGTLDEEALDTALQTLAELRQDGKLIGIISHVPVLKERIDLRIQVQPGSEGCSRLLGPGCVQLA